MPNVMGREFPYTPGGMAAARQYSQAMGMRDGGLWAFARWGMPTAASRTTTDPDWSLRSRRVWEQIYGAQGVTPVDS
jgi:hypothetical protein